MTNTNPFLQVCPRCHTTMSIHSLRGRKAYCEDGHDSPFELWQVVATKRALGHKINTKMSHAAFQNKKAHHDS